MVDNYLYTTWKYLWTLDIYRVVWQQTNPDGLPFDEDSALLVLEAIVDINRPLPRHLIITIPKAMLSNEVGFIPHQIKKADT